MRFLTSSVCAVALTVGIAMPAVAQTRDAQTAVLPGIQSSFEVAASGSTGQDSGNFELPGTSRTVASAPAFAAAAPTFGADFSMWNTSTPLMPLAANAKPAAPQGARVAAAPQPVVATVLHPRTATVAIPRIGSIAPPVLNRLANGLFSRTRELAGRLTASAMHFIGTPYVFGGTSVTGFDCSGYVQHVFAMIGVSLPRTADAQYAVGQHVAQRQMVPGDLVFFQTYTSGVSHVGIYLGNNSFIHSSSRGVAISSLRESYWSARYVGATHVLGTNVGEVAAASHTVN